MMNSILSTDQEKDLWTNLPKDTIGIFKFYDLAAKTVVRQSRQFSVWPLTSEYAVRALVLSNAIISTTKTWLTGCCFDVFVYFLTS